MFVVDQITPQYITVTTRGTVICFAYQRPRGVGEDFDPNKEWSQSPSSMVIGDMNASYPTWSKGRQNLAGLRLKNWMDERDMTVLNPFMNTNTTSRGGSTFNITIDLVIATYGSRTKVKSVPIASTSHTVLSIKTNLEWQPTAERPLRYDKADWDSIRAGTKLMDLRDTAPE